MNRLTNIKTNLFIKDVKPETLLQPLSARTNKTTYYRITKEEPHKSVRSKP